VLRERGEGRCTLLGYSSVLRVIGRGGERAFVEEGGEVVQFALC
jgi:hypothetical protein